MDRIEVRWFGLQIDDDVRFWLRFLSILVWEKCMKSTYIFLYSLLRPAHRLDVRDVALVKPHVLQPFALLLRRAHVQNGHADASHPVRLREHFAQPTCSAGDYDDFLIPVQLPWRAPCQSLVQLVQ